MAKQRRKDKKLKKYFKIFLVVLVLGLIIIGIGYYNLRNQELEVLADYTQPATHKDFNGYDLYLNDKDSPQEYVFVSDSSSALDNFIGAMSYDYIKSAGILYYEGNDGYLSAGRLCSRQQLIRFTYCDNAYDKTKCETDIFDNLWLVNTFTDYPNFASYYTGSGDGFYYTYSCYEKDEYKAITVPDDVERKYLYDYKCISSDNPNWDKGTNYDTELKCLEALADALDDLNNEPETCSYRTYNEYVCKTNNLYQKERETDCDTGYTLFLRRCDYGCEDGSCKAEPENTCTYQEFNDFKCIGDVKYQKVKERDCSVDYSLPVGSCNVDLSGDDDIIIVDTNETSEDNDSIVLGDGFSDVECKAYEIGYNKNALGYTTDCKFDFKKSFSNQGLKTLWKDYPNYIIGSLMIFVIIVLLIVIRVRGGKKK